MVNRSDILPGSQFQIVVLLVGTNNIENSAEEVAEGVAEAVNSIRDKLPDTYIILPVSTMAYSQNEAACLPVI